MRMCVRLRTMQSTVLRRAKEPTNSVEDEGQERLGCDTGHVKTRKN